MGFNCTEQLHLDPSAHGPGVPVELRLWSVLVCVVPVSSPVS